MAAKKINGLSRRAAKKLFKQYMNPANGMVTASKLRMLEHGVELARLWGFEVSSERQEYLRQCMVRMLIEHIELLRGLGNGSSG